MNEPRRAASLGPGPRQPGHGALGRPPHERRSQDDARDQHRGGCGRNVEIEVVVREPAHRQDREGRRVARRQDQCHVDDRERKGEDSEDGQPDLVIEQREDDLQPSDRGPLPEHACRSEQRAGRDLGRSRDDHQDQVGCLLQHQPDHQRQTHGVAQRHEPGRRVLPARRPGRQEADDPAARRHQEGKPQRDGAVRAREHEGQYGSHPAPARPGQGLRREGYGQAEGQERRRCAGRQGQAQRGGETRSGGQGPPSRERQRRPADRRHHAESGQERKHQACRDRARHEQNRGDRGKPQHGIAMGSSVFPTRP